MDVCDSRIRYGACDVGLSGDWQGLGGSWLGWSSWQRLEIVGETRQSRTSSQGQEQRARGHAAGRLGCSGQASDRPEDQGACKETRRNDSHDLSALMIAGLITGNRRE